MSVIFETPRFRIHIAGEVAWLEERELGNWILRGQTTVPIPVESLEANGHLSLFQEAVQEFEQVRPGNTNLRAALTGYRGAATVKILPGRITRTPQKRSPPGRSRSIWTPRPLRPPLAAKVL